jgi:hypothetical protein
LWCRLSLSYAPHGGRTADFTYSRITVHNASTLEWEQMSALEAGAVIDRFFIETPEHGSFAARFGGAGILHGEEEVGGGGGQKGFAAV